jgi:hypothetical protein
VAREANWNDVVPAKVFYAPPIVLDARSEGETADWKAPDGTYRGFWCGISVSLSGAQVLAVQPLDVGVEETGFHVLNGAWLGACTVTRTPGFTPSARVEIPLKQADSLSEHLARDGRTTRLDLTDLRVEVFCYAEDRFTSLPTGLCETSLPVGSEVLHLLSGFGVE